jgi:hypothetical protein
MEGGVPVEKYMISTAALVGSEWSPSRPGSITPEGSPRYQCDEGMSRLQNPTGRCEKGKSVAPTGTELRSPDRLLSQSVAI